MEISSTEEMVPKRVVPSKVQFCMICLESSSECKLYPANSYNLYLEFEHLTGISLQGEVHFVPQFCTECAHRLGNCGKFRHKSLTAYQLLMGLVEKQETLTARNIKTLISTNNFTSSITKKSFQPDNWDLHIIYEEQEESKNDKPIKVEVELLYDKLIMKPVTKIECNENEGEELNEYKTEDSDDLIYNNVEYLEDIDDEIMYINMDCDEEVKDEVDNIENKKTIQPRTRKNAIKKVRNTKTGMDSESLDYLKQYTIKTLTHNEQLFDIQKRKEKESFSNTLFKCMKCYKEMFSIDTYKAHMEKHTDKYGKFICKICKLHMKSKLAVNKHMTNNHSKRYSCKDCPLVTNHRTTAVNHAAMHRGTVYKCPHCPEELRSKSGYFFHKRVSHPTDIACTLCGYSFINQKGLGLHMKLKHMGENIPEIDGPLCELCDIRFASQTAYHRHLEVSPTHAPKDLRKRNAPTQSRVYGRNHAKRKKEKRLKDNPAYADTPTVTCEVCDMELEGFRAYYLHFRLGHPDKTRGQHPPNYEPCLCELCGNTFINRYVLKDHMLQHSGKKQFQCDLCKKTFFVKSNLQMHMRVHCQPLYQCTVCEKRFTTKQNCARHVWIHQEQKPHACGSCDKTFESQWSMRAHVQHVHLKQPYPAKKPQRRADTAGT